MKYITKDMQELIDDGLLPICFTPTPSAKKKSERYFRTCYQEGLNGFLNIKKWSAENHHRPFDQEAAQKEFEARYQERLETYSKLFPQEVLALVADIRVLALGYCSSKAKHVITKFCNMRRAKGLEAVRAYDDYMMRRIQHFPARLVDLFHFGDAVITDLHLEDGTLTIRFDNQLYESPNRTAAAVFHNVTILEREENLVGAQWLCEELYKVPNGYEFHGILEDQEGYYRYLTFQASDAEFLDENGVQVPTKEESSEDNFEEV